jgi:hypothetical protein
MGINRMGKQVTEGLSEAQPNWLFHMPDSIDQYDRHVKSQLGKAAASHCVTRLPIGLII